MEGDGNIMEGGGNIMEGDRLRALSHGEQHRLHRRNAWKPIGNE